MRPVLSRRGLALGLAAIPIAGGASIAAPPSDLAQACLWCVADRARVDREPPQEGWDDEMLDAAINRHDAVFTRAISEPSSGLGDLRAKAKLALDDFDRFVDAFRPDNLDDGERLLKVVLQEVIALCA